MERGLQLHGLRPVQVYTRGSDLLARTELTESERERVTGKDGAGYGVQSGLSTLSVHMTSY